MKIEAVHELSTLNITQAGKPELHGCFRYSYGGNTPVRHLLQANSYITPGMMNGNGFISQLKIQRGNCGREGTHELSMGQSHFPGKMIGDLFARNCQDKALYLSGVRYQSNLELSGCYVHVVPFRPDIHVGRSLPFEP